MHVLADSSIDRRFCLVLVLRLFYPFESFGTSRIEFALSAFSLFRLRSRDTAVVSSSSFLSAREILSASSVNTILISCAISRHSASVPPCRSSLNASCSRVSGLWCPSIRSASGIPCFICSIALLNCVSFAAVSNSLSTSGFAPSFAATLPLFPYDPSLHSSLRLGDSRRPNAPMPMAQTLRAPSL